VCALGKALNQGADAAVVPMRTLAAAAFLLLAVVLAGCSGGSAGATVEVNDNAFDPKTFTVDAGEEVHFEVAGSNPHTVTIHKAGDPLTTLLMDEDVRSGDDVHFTFAAAGTYHVWCTVHGQMTSGMAMVVTVE
jgi:plastocyanin